MAPGVGGMARRWPWWAVIAFMVGLVIAVLHGLPGRAGLYLETLLLLSFWYAIGGLLGIWLGRARSQDALVTANAVEDARLAVAAKGCRRRAQCRRRKSCRRCAAWLLPQKPPKTRVWPPPQRPPKMHARPPPQKLPKTRGWLLPQRPPKMHAMPPPQKLPKTRVWLLPRRPLRMHAGRRRKSCEDARKAAAAKAAEEARQAPAAKVTEAVRAAAAAATVAPSPAISTQHPGTRPQGIAAPEGHADDLKLIKGIGPKNEKISNALGIYHFRQIADWTPEEAIWVGHHMAFPGRIEREHWIPQAKLLASGGDTDHSAGVQIRHHRCR